MNLRCQIAFHNSFFLLKRKINKPNRAGSYLLIKTNRQTNWYLFPKAFFFFFSPSLDIMVQSSNSDGKEHTTDERKEETKKKRKKEKVMENL